MAIFIPADPTQPLREVAPKNGKNFHLAQLYTLLSCTTIDILHLADGRIMVLDDEGKLTGKPRNERATRLVGFASPGQVVAELLRLREEGIEVFWAGEPITDMTVEVDFIAGDVLVCENDEVR